MLKIKLLDLLNEQAKPPKEDLNSGGAKPPKENLNGSGTNSVSKSKYFDVAIASGDQLEKTNDPNQMSSKDNKFAVWNTGRVAYINRDGNMYMGNMEITGDKSYKIKYDNGDVWDSVTKQITKSTNVNQQTQTDKTSTSTPNQKNINDIQPLGSPTDFNFKDKNTLGNKVKNCNLNKDGTIRDFKDIGKGNTMPGFEYGCQSQALSELKKMLHYSLINDGVYGDDLLHKLMDITAITPEQESQAISDHKLLINQKIIDDVKILNPSFRDSVKKEPVQLGGQNLPDEDLYKNQPLSETIRKNTTKILTEQLIKINTKKALKSYFN
jgi:hypothetical protein